MGREDVLFSHMESLTKHVNGTRAHLGVLAREIVDGKIRGNAANRVLARTQVVTFRPSNWFQRVIVGPVVRSLGFVEAPALSEKEFSLQMDEEDKAAKSVAEKAMVAQMSAKLNLEKGGVIVGAVK